jgi:hypothetical protein
LLLSVSRLTSQPSATVPLQLRKSGAQLAIPQAELAQKLVALGTAGQGAQPLQWPGSKRGSTQEPLQAMSGAWQLAWHTPAVHTLPAPHTAPGLPLPPAPQAPVAPQFAALVVGSTQMPPQLICPPGQETWHVPPEHTLPTAQAVPGVPFPPAPHAPVAPQLERLVSGSTQTPPQLTWLPGHETWQLPPAHTLPPPQTAPGVPLPPAPQAPVAPQLERLVNGSTQTPPQLI